MKIRHFTFPGKYSCRIFNESSFYYETNNAAVPSYIKGHGMFPCPAVQTKNLDFKRIS